jgi:TonB-dependent starch-binding outer membrane protein SusC
MAYPFNNGANATREWLTDAWTPENPDARLPMVMEANRAEVADNFRDSDFWLKDGSYLRLKNIQLGYSLPPSLLNRLGIQQLTVFANEQNWLTLTRGGPHHIDIETATDKVSLHHYPMMKTVTTGISVNF